MTKGHNVRAVTDWDGKTYPRVLDAAKAFGLSYEAARLRSLKGYAPFGFKICPSDFIGPHRFGERAVGFRAHGMGTIGSAAEITPQEHAEREIRIIRLRAELAAITEAKFREFMRRKKNGGVK